METTGLSEASDYILLSRKQQKLTGDLSVLDSLFVSEVRTYIKREVSTRTTYSASTGYHTFFRSSLYYKTETPEGAYKDVEALAASSADAFWGVDDTTGSHNTIEQLSNDWYIVTVVEKGAFKGKLVYTYLTPDKEEYLFYELVDRKSEDTLPDSKVPAFGTAHPRITTHSFVDAVPADSIGDFYRYYYAPKKFTDADQEKYNWAYKSTDIGSAKFRTVERTYVTLRTGYDSTKPKINSLLTSISAIESSVSYVLMKREQRQMTGAMAALDSLFVEDVRTYIDLTPLTRVTFDKRKGSHTFYTTTIYYKDDVVGKGGSQIKDISTNTSDAAWKIDTTTGAHKEVEQLSDDWYAVTEVSVGDAVGRTVYLYPTPDMTESILYDLVDRKVETIAPTPLPAIDDAHSTDTAYKFVGATPADGTGDVYRFYYAKPRDEDTQKKYNKTESTANIGGQKFDTYERRFVTLRTVYDKATLKTGTVESSEGGEGGEGGGGGEGGESEATFVLISRRSRQLTGVDEQLASLYIEEIRTYAKVVVFTENTYDELFGELLETTTKLVHSSKKPAAVDLNATGYVTELRQLTADWFIETKRQLMKKTGILRTFDSTENVRWPAVLNSFYRKTWNKRDGTQQYFVIPAYSRDEYFGPTKVEIEISWNKDSVTCTPDKPMIPTPISADFPIVSYRSKSALHGEFTFSGTTGTENTTYKWINWNHIEQATNYPDWPAQIIISDDQRPFRGGFLRQKTTAFIPDPAVFTPSSSTDIENSDPAAPQRPPSNDPSGGGGDTGGDLTTRQTKQITLTFCSRSGPKITNTFNTTSQLHYDSLIYAKSKCTGVAPYEGQSCLSEACMNLERTKYIYANVDQYNQYGNRI